MDSAASPSPQGGQEQHLVIVRLQDRPGAMERVLGLLRRRAPAVTAVSFAPTEDPDELRVTIALRGAHAGIAHVVSQLRKLEDVRSAGATPAAKTDREAVVRELVLVRVACDTASRREIVDIAHLFGARAVDVTGSSLTLEMSGDDDTIENLLRFLQPIGIREIARTGKVLLWRDESTTATSGMADTDGTGDTGDTRPANIRATG
ncbi:MAG TPA: acetolactate synthase small subunit [Ktedonobacterales bacterium]|nr:acetolactate synthase small subunit [Ktedonobacterales bacterium]